MGAPRASLFAALLLGAVLPSCAADRDFEAVVKRLESRLQGRRTRIPLFGLAKLCVRVARPEGVKQLDLAVFEELNAVPDAAGIDAMMREAVGDRWQPLLRVRSRQRESTCIYSHPGASDLHLLLVTFEPSEAAVMRLRVNPQVLLNLVADPAHRARELR